VAIGWRPAHPAKSRAAKDRGINHPEHGSLARTADRRSVTRGTAVI